MYFLDVNPYKADPILMPGIIISDNRPRIDFFETKSECMIMFNKKTGFRKKGANPLCALGEENVQLTVMI